MAHKETNGLTIEKTITNAIAKYGSPDSEIAKMHKEYITIKLLNQEDKEGYKVIKNALAIVSKVRIDTEKIRKELKAIALKYGTAIDNEAKRIKALVNPIELHLKTQKALHDDYLAEIERQKAEEIRLKAEAERIRLEEENRELKAQLAEHDDIVACFANDFEKDNDISDSEKALSSYDTLTKIVQQLESCNYQNEAGELVSDIAFIKLKRMAECE